MPQMYWIIPVEGGHPDNSLPGQQPGRPSHPIHNPPYPDQGLPGGQPYPDQGLPGGQPYPDQGLPGGQPGPSHPIYHPGHPEHGRPSHPIAGQPGSPSHPIHIPGVPDQGLPPGENIPSNELPPIPVPPQYQEDLVIGVKQPNSTEWTFTAYEVKPDQGQPAPSPH